ncbi:MAG: cupin-like domain-containing protein [Kofleriaceae bacterium]
MDLARLALDDRDGFERHVRDEVPAIVVGGARAWPAVTRWTPAYLAERIGDAAVRWKLSASNVHPNFRAASLAEMFATEAGTFAELLAAITTGEPAERARRLFTGDEKFLLRRRDGVTTIDEALRPLLQDVILPIPMDRLYTVWAWFSGPGVYTWLHYDNNACHNLNAQLVGSKRCVLYAPDELARMAPFVLGGDNPAYNCSSLDVEREPLAGGLTGQLDTGDLLFIPAWWFHSFTHAGDFNANVNVWWKPETPRWNAVAARQALVDSVAAAKLDPKDPVTSGILRRLDAAAIARTA